MIQFIALSEIKRNQEIKTVKHEIEITRLKKEEISNQNFIEQVNYERDLRFLNMKESKGFKTKLKNKGLLQDRKFKYRGVTNE